MKKHEVHNLICESLIAILNEDPSEQVDFQRGVKAGLKAKVHGGKHIIFPEQLKQQSAAFVKGYNKAMGEDWWTRFNNKLTQFATNLGYSRIKGL